MQSQRRLVARVSAPGKAILCGEHAVIYGEDAIALGISLRCSASIFLEETDPGLQIESHEHPQIVYDAQYASLLTSSCLYTDFLEQLHSMGRQLSNW